METREVTIRILEGFGDAMTKKEAEQILDGHCPNCKNDSMALVTSDDFTGFHQCWECQLTIHGEVVEMFK